MGKPMELRAGPLTMVLEADTGFLRYVRLGERELLRGVYAAVRNENWDTIEPEVRDLKVAVAERSFQVTFEVECRRDPVWFTWSGALAGEADGTLTYSLDGVARSTFLKNRIGFCVLHPAETCAGQEVRVEHVDGTVETGVFPEQISPHQPFREIRVLTEPVGPNAGADWGKWRFEVRMEDEAFEMEDQRNWTDASFKTYCTPLDQPFPVEIAAGTRVRQSVRLRLHSPNCERPSMPPLLGSGTGSGDEPVRLRLDPDRSYPLPDVGLQVAGHGRPLSPREVELLRALRLSHLRADVRPDAPDFPVALELAAEQSRLLGVPLELAWFLPEDPETVRGLLVAELERLRPEVARWLVFRGGRLVSDAEGLAWAREVLTAYQPEPVVGGGSNTNFAELNRSSLAAADLDFVSFAVNPQVHAFDDASLVETLPMQEVAVRSAQARFPAREVYVSPVTLRPRFNAVATGPEAPPHPGALPWAVDPRQPSLFAAGWTLGSLKYVTQSGAAGITYYETTGWRGVMESDDGSPAPFPSVPGTVFPLYHVLRDFQECRGGSLLACRSSRPLEVEGVYLRSGDGERLRVLVANLTGAPRLVSLDFPAGKVRVRTLDETTSELAARDPEAFRVPQDAEPVGAWEWRFTDGSLHLELRPHAVVRIDRE